MITEDFKKMSCRLAVQFGLSNCDDWEALPDALKVIFSQIEYRNLVAPLVWHDRETLCLTWQQLANKYRISIQTVRTILAKPNPNLYKKR